MPFHESKLTTLLRGALGGNSRTTFVVTCSLADAHAEETVNALKMGERCSMIATHASTSLGSFDTAASLGAALVAVRAALEQVLALC